MEHGFTMKYEVVCGIPDDEFKNGGLQSNENKYVDKWQEFAKEYFDQTGIYVSAIANFGKAIYHEDWGCPLHGERTVTFNCTANPTFIKDIEAYKNGVLYIAGKLKKEFKQNTITITKMTAGIHYLTNDEVDNV